MLFCVNYSFFALLACSLTLAACGGGDSDDNPPPNSPPGSLTSTPALLQVAEDTGLTAQLSASDPNGDSLSYSLSAQAAHGTVAITMTGAVTYTPAANYNGADAFSATASDGRGGSTVGTFNITVTAVNDAPSITGPALNYTEDQESTQNLTVTDPEGDSFSVVDVTPPAHGAVTSIDANGGVSYQPDANFHGQDSFTVRATDSHGAASPAVTVTLNVASVNDAPVAVNDSFLFTAGAQPFDVAANDTDVDGDALIVSVLTQPAVGTVSVVNNKIVYQPAGNFAGPLQFTYRVTDAGNATADATVNLSVGAFPAVYIRSTRPDSHTFDGYAVTKWSTDYEGAQFAIAGNGRNAAYAGRYTQSDRGSVFVFDASQPMLRPGNPRRAFARGGEPTGALQFAFDSAASQLFISDPQTPLSVGPKTYNYVLFTATGDVASITTPADVFTSSAAVFNTAGTAFYMRAAVSNAVTPTPNVASTYTSLFEGNVAGRTLTRIGATYPVGVSDGSGLNIRVTPNGRYVLHAAVTHGPTIGSLLVNDRVSNTETDLYRDFAAGEFPLPYQFALNLAGSSACFRVNTAGAAAEGPGRIWIANPAAPGAATAVTPTADSNSDCQWASDGKSIGYLSHNGSTAEDAWIVDPTVPNVVQRLREPLVAGESVTFLALAQDSPLAVVAVTESAGATTKLYSVALDAPGTSTRIASIGAVGANPHYALDPGGNWIGYIKADTVPGTGTVQRVHLASTRQPDTELIVNLPAAANAETFTFMNAPGFVP